MRRHLADARLSHMEDAVIGELGRVREELGWPIVMTPVPLTFTISRLTTANPASVNVTVYTPGVRF